MRCHVDDMLAGQVVVVEQAVETLQRAGRRIRCSELQILLESLGFYFKDKKTTNHKVYFHDHLPNFSSSSFNCDHGRDPEVKNAYLQKAKRSITQNRDDLLKYLTKREQE